MTTKIGMQGYPPIVKVEPLNPEVLKYQKLWAMKEYRAAAPGEGLASVFLHHAHPRPGSEVIDFGCGTGRGALMLALLGRLVITMVDFTDNCLDPEIREALTTQAHALKFIKADLEHSIPAAAEYGFCTDVMEHIPPEKVSRVLVNILKAAKHVFFSIATTDDKCGALIGEPLHLTVQPATIAGQTQITPPAGALSLDGTVPTFDFGITTPTGSLTLTGTAPTLQEGIQQTPPSGALQFAGAVPELRIDIRLTPPAGAITLTGSAPDLPLGNTSITPDTGTLTIAGYPPSLEAFVTAPSYRWIRTASGRWVPVYGTDWPTVRGGTDWPAVRGGSSWKAVR